MDNTDPHRLRVEGMLYATQFPAVLPNLRSPSAYGPLADKLYTLACETVRDHGGHEFDKYRYGAECFVKLAAQQVFNIDTTVANLKANVAATLRRIYNSAHFVIHGER